MSETATPNLAGMSREEKLALLARLAQQKKAASEPMGPAPLSFAQQRFWFLDQLDPGSYLDNMFRALRLTGPLDIAALERALRELVQRHASLRTRFPAENGEPRQVVEPELPGGGPLPVLVDLTEGDSLARAVEFAGEESRRPFDLANGPLFRATLLRLGPEDHALLLCVHHIVSDGWSQGLLIRELAALYGSSTLPELKARYVDFARWQRERLQGEALKQELAFWRERLEGAPAILELPTDHPRRHMASPRGDAVTFEILDPAAARFKALAQAEGATLFMALLALFDVLLFRYAGQGDFVVGVPVANRNRTELEGVVGCFASTLLVRAGVERGMSFRSLLAKVRDEALAVFAHSDLPFEKLVEELQPDRNLSHNPLFQVVFALQNAGGGARLTRLTMPGLTLSNLPVERGLAKIDLTLEMVELPGGISGYFEYSTDLFEEPTIARMAGHFQALLAAALAEPDRAVGELPILSEEEKRQILVDWNRRAEDLPRQIMDRLAEVARRNPDAPAVFFGDERLTHGELHRRANRLARHLRKLGVGPEMSVGLCVERSLEMPLALLAVLKANGAWVPLDPEYPQERLALMIEDTAMPVLLTQSHLVDRLPRPNGHGPALISIDRLDLSGEDDSDPDWEIHPESLAYIVYTSGSTGRPKGVAVPHRSFANHAVICAERYRLGPDDRVLQFTSISFDITSEEIFPTWLMGGAVVPRPPGLFPSFDELEGLINRYGITAVDLPTAYWHEWVGELARAKTPPPPSLRLVVIGTEQALPERVADWLELAGAGTGRARLNNSYASTEATVTTIVYEPTVADIPRFRAGDRVPVGKNIRNCRAYVLDSALEPVPVGVPGDVYIAGPNVSRGYANWPDRTAASFVPDPFAWEMGYGTGQRMYRQGDVGRWLPTGDLEYLGRRDDQVKIRGFRVEPAEVGAVLARHPAVKDSIVLVRSDGPKGKRLVGYLTLVPGVQATVRELRDFLRESLPDHMIPAALVVMDALPLTSNGRVDQRALPEPAIDGEGSYVPPQTATEEILEGIWCEVLGTARAGSNDDFFDLGGHSLLGTQVVSRARERFRVEVPLRELFDHPTLSGLARRIEEIRRAESGTAAPRIEPIARDGAMELSFSQQRLWFLDQLEPGRGTYNIPLALHFEGPLDAGALAMALNDVARRHEALRTTFTAVDGQPRQVVNPAGPADLPIHDLSGLDPDERNAETWRRIAGEARLPFSLERGPLVRTTLLRLNNEENSEEHVLLVTMHHIVSDGWSVPIYVREMAALYDGFTTGRPQALPPLPIQYADFAHWQRRWLQGETLEAELSHWRERLGDLPPLLELPTDRPRPAVRQWSGAARRVTLGGDLSESLRTVSRRLGATPFMVTLAAFAALLHRYSRQESFAVGVPVAGRNRVEVEPLIGFFVNTLALRCDVTGDTEVRALVERLRETVLDADAHQDVPFEKLVEELSPERSLSHTPIFQVMLAFQNLPRQDFPAEGLKVTSLGTTSGTVKLDLKLSVQADDDRTTLYVEYGTEIFDAATIGRFADHLGRLLEGALAAPERRVSELPLLAPSEAQQILEWNDTSIPSAGPLLHELFEAQAARVPDQPAVTFEDRTLTYGELNGTAGRLARRLRALGVGPEARVGICVERGPEMITGLLAVLKAGGAYVPLDPASPKERLDWMIEDAGITVLLTRERLLELDGEDGKDVGTSAHPENPAYVIYTSGSTGRPKGVVVEHRQLANYVAGVTERLGLASCRSFAMVSTFAADLGNTVLFPALATGGTLHILSEDRVTSPVAFAEYLSRNAVDCLKIVPSHLAALISVDDPARALPKRCLVLGGEAASWELIEQIRRLAPDCTVFNHYGPTETTVGVLTCPLNEITEDRPAMPPLGRPLPGSRVHLLDAQLQPVPPGVPGEVFIGGAGLARGYLGRPDLTADRFVPDPLGVPGARLYRTGDLARRTADGRLVFSGRADHQVKIRGFRVELGEIEAALSRHPAVSQAVVVVREGSLAAYYVPAEGQDVSAANLRAALRETLPDAMVPSWLVPLPAIPLTANGKVDRRALPAPEGSAPGREFVAPEGDVQERLAAIWSEVLRLDRVGATDNFFELGGHSLLATQVISRVQKVFGVELTLRVLFEHQTVAGLAEAIIQRELEKADADLLARLLSELENA